MINERNIKKENKQDKHFKYFFPEEIININIKTHDPNVITDNLC